MPSGWVSSKGNRKGLASASPFAFVAVKLSKGRVTSAATAPRRWRCYLAESLSRAHDQAIGTTAIASATTKVPLPMSPSVTLSVPLVMLTVARTWKAMPPLLRPVGVCV